MKITQQEQERFNSKWKQVGDCRLWQGPLDKDGYGTFFFRKMGRRAHRVSYFAHSGDIPTGMYVDHICGARSCVAPGHLRLVSPRQNALENSNSIAAKNALRTHCNRGHKFDRKYGNQRYCSTCQAEKSKRLRTRWRTEDTVAC